MPRTLYLILSERKRYDDITAPSNNGSPPHFTQTEVRRTASPAGFFTCTVIFE